MSDIFFCTKRELPTFEVVERKGLGHPDTLADMVAEEFSNQYSLFTLNKYGKILNHWVDKVLLSGGVSDLDYGHSNIVKPITAYLFGKVVRVIGQEIVPIEQIFKSSVIKIFSDVFGENNKILENIIFFIDANQGIGKDHVRNFYFPKTGEEIVNETTANDSVFCCGHAPYTATELLAIKLENYINSKKFKSKFFMTGYDVKVLITRVDDFLEITICIPFVATLTPSVISYKKNLEQIRLDVNRFIKKNFSWNRYDLLINTKDRGDFGYLVAFGTALDKGDFGAVGRGNKYNGLISENSDSNIEAVSGKNPLNHSGKLYTILAHDLSVTLFKTNNTKNKIIITSKNGDPIDKPSKLIVCLDDTKRPPLNLYQCEETIRRELPKVKKLYKKIIRGNAVKNHVMRRVLI